VVGRDYQGGVNATLIVPPNHFLIN
jgi:hypothetical protein